MMKKLFSSLLLFLFFLTNTCFAAGIDAYTKLLLHLNGTDGSKSHPITFNGNAHLDTSQSKFGERGASGLFGGVGTDFLSSVDHADWNFGTGNFTIDW
jgi:hypothetical protein